VKQNKMNYVKVANSTGAYVDPDEHSFKAAAANAEWNKSFFQLLTNQPGKESWPIVGATFVLMQKVQDKPESAAEVLKFFDYSFKNGDKTAESIDYLVMPAAVKDTIRKSWGVIKDASGKTIAY
jgi:phosphate transport system substrate-binding protein